MFEQIKKQLIVSCQALADEPLHSSYIMSKMALAAKIGGAKGIRANSKEDIAAIKEEVDLPVIGIVKRDYADSEIYITPTMKEIDELMEVHPDMIALDATSRIRPHQLSLAQFISSIREKYPDMLLMADCSTLEECIQADKLGFDAVGTTLVGYTPSSQGVRIEEDDFSLLQQMIQAVSCPVIAEGNIDTPQKAKRVLELGAHAVVVGSIITRPQIITARFTQAIEEV